MILPVLCPRAWSALEVTGNFCVRHIRSQGDSLGTLMAVRSQKIKKRPKLFWGMIYSQTLPFFPVLSIAVCTVHQNRIILRQSVEEDV